MLPAFEAVHSSRVTFRRADTGEETHVPVPSDRPVLIVTYDSLDLSSIQEAINRADYGNYARLTLIGGAAAPHTVRPNWDYVGPERIEMLPLTSSSWRTMAAAYAKALELGDKPRRTLFGPDLAILEQDPHTTVRTTLCGSRRRGRIETAGHPSDWPGDLLAVVLAGCERAVLDPEEPLPEIWRGRPAQGESYVKIICDRTDRKAWRQAIRARSPGAEVRSLPERRRRAS